MGKRSGATNGEGTLEGAKAYRRGRGGGVADGAAPGQRGRPRRPPPVPKDLPQQAAVRAKPLKMGASCLRDMSPTILPNDRSLARNPKQTPVQMLMPHHERLAAMFTSAAAMQPQAARPPSRKNIFLSSACGCAAAAASIAVACNGPAITVAAAASAVSAASAPC